MTDLSPLKECPERLNRKNRKRERPAAIWPKKADQWTDKVLADKHALESKAHAGAAVSGSKFPARPLAKDDASNNGGVGRKDEK
jgi:hypothetical protein